MVVLFVCFNKSLGLGLRITDTISKDVIIYARTPAEFLTTT